MQQSNDIERVVFLQDQRSQAEGAQDRNRLISLILPFAAQVALCPLLLLASRDSDTLLKPLGC